MLAAEVLAEEVLAVEVPASSRATTHGVPGSSEAVTGGGSLGADCLPAHTDDEYVNYGL